MALPDWDGKSTLRQLTAQVDLLTNDLQRIAQALGIGAKPYSGHEAMDQDILPTIERWKRDRDLTATALYDAKVEEGRLQAQIRVLEAIRGDMRAAKLIDDPASRLRWYDGIAARLAPTGGATEEAQGG